MPTIRKAVPGEETAVAGLVERTVREIYPRFYPGGIVDFFVYHHRPEVIRSDIDEGLVYVSELDGEIVGTVTLRRDRIDRLFVPPEHQGRGYGKQLMLFSEETIFSAYEHAFVDAALPSVKMYHRNGYITVEYGERHHEGCTLIFPLMVKMNPDIRRD